MRLPEHYQLFLLFALLPLIPVCLFLQTSDPNITNFIIISRVAGIYAFVWYALQFIVTARSRHMERFISQERRLLLHMFVAAGALVIVFVHTSFGNEKYVSELQAGLGGTAETIFLWATLFSGLFFSNYFVRFLPDLMSHRDRIATLLKLTHERCLMLHYAMPAGMVLLIAHIAMIPGKGLIQFKVCMVMIGISSLSFFLYYKIIVPKMMRRHPWKVINVVMESDSVVTIYFHPPPTKRIKHHAGQFCYIRPINKGIPGESHPFTISSGPLDHQLSITVKTLGDFTEKMNGIKPDSAVCIDGPYGKFSYEQTSPDCHLVFIAGGIGITPMLSMLRDLSIKAPKRRVILIWGARYQTDLICLDEIKTIRKKMSHFAFEPVLSRELNWKGYKGRIDKKILEEVLSSHGVNIDSSNRIACEFFICGPAQMTTDMLQVFKEKKIPDRVIHTERFTF